MFRCAQSLFLQFGSNAEKCYNEAGCSEFMLPCQKCYRSANSTAESYRFMLSLGKTLPYTASCDRFMSVHISVGSMFSTEDTC